MPRLTIDEREVEVPAGTNLIEAARQIGASVPHYCYHPALSIAASCRMCQVELHAEGQPPRVIVACQTEAAEGMVVSTDGEDCKQAREATLEFLLANHPLDCPICDKAGECDLQNFSYWHGKGQGRFSEPKREGLKHTPIGNHILLDQERCILCTRCTRFMDEVAQKPQLIVTGRGDRNVIDIFPGQPIDSDYEGNLADICPVGALTLKEFRFKSRVWDLTYQDSVCPLCDRGCSIQLETKRNRLLRVRPRLNEQVNGHFMCDRGRFGPLEFCNPQHRVTEAFVAGARQAPRDAVAALHQRLQEHSGQLIVLLSARLTNEEILRARQAFAPHAREGGLVFLPVAEAGADDILYTGRAAANEAGLRACGILPRTREELQALLAEDGSQAVVCFDAKQAEELDLSRHACLLLIDVWEDADPQAAPAGAEVALPGQLFSEKEGTYLNFESVLQRLRRAQRSPPAIPGELDLLTELARTASDLAGVEETTDPTAAVLTSWGLAPLTLAQIPALGLKLERAAADTPTRESSGKVSAT